MPRLAAFATLAVGAAGAACKPGYKAKKVLTGLTCDTNDSTSAKFCNTNCCEPDDKTCGGLAVACTNGYKYASDATQAEKDAWAATAATAKTAQEMCCTKKATCGSGAYTCPAGKKQGNTPNAVCASDPASCANSASCCIADVLTCGGSGYTATAAQCAAPLAVPADKTTDAWKGEKFATGKEKENCCASQVTCASNAYSCPAGSKKNTKDVKTQVCPSSDPASCADETDVKWTIGTPPALVAAADRCCIKEGKTCGGLSTPIACIGNTFKDAALNNQPATSANSAQACCSTKATCAQAACPAGQKMKANVAASFCNTDAASCATTCCENDAATCGGLKATSGLSCPVGTYDESTKFAAAKYTKAQINAWKSKAATAATAVKVCCTKLAACAAPAVAGATTTPVAVITTTPVAPARLFSDHKAAVASSEQSSPNMIWFAVGGFIGMSVLFVAQKLRPRSRFDLLENEQ